jgi:hypothetical protein
LACCLVWAIVPFAAAQEAKQETDKAATPFWLAPKAALDLRALVPADVKLVAPPDRSRELAVLQIGNYDPRDSVSGDLYRVVAGGLKVGGLPFSDRRYSIEQLPDELSGLTLLQTKLQDRVVLDVRFGIVLETAKACWVFVAVEENSLETYKQHGVPSWLQEYAPTGHQLVTGNGNFRVFFKMASAGRIVLGPPCVELRNYMYFAFFAEAK